MSDKEVEIATWFWNESANEIDLDSEDEGSRDVDGENLKGGQSKTK